MNQNPSDFLLKLKSRSLLWLGASLGLILVVGTIVHGIPFAFWKSSTAASFNISGVTGGTDATTDIYLSNGTNPTIHFATLAGATSYDVVVKDSAGVTTLCSSLSQASSPVSPAGCGLTNSTTYKVYVTGNPGSIAASNNGFSFTVDNTPPTTNTITGITGASDAVVDVWLTGGVLATVNWNAFTNAASYDVTIKDSAGTTTVCATQNTTSTSYNFSGCTLTDGTAYRAYVTAKSPVGFQTTDASNTAFNFTVDNTAPGSFSITGIKGGTDTYADAYLANGTDPTVVYGTSSNVYRYDLVIKDSTGTTTVCSLLNQTGSPSAMTCGLTIGLTYKAYITAKSISGYLTTTASNNGYSFIVDAPPAIPTANFLITGATGGTDNTADTWLSSGTTVTANWNAAAGAQAYNVTIRNSTDTADVCATQNTTSTSYTFTGCTLTNATSYLIKVSATNPPAIPTVATNNSYPFTVITPAPVAFAITGATGGTDATVDNLLMNGNIVTANWNASSGAASYDVTIRNSGDTADVCATQNTTSTTYTFTGCTLSINTTYTIKVVAKNGALSTPAYNGPFSFLVPNALTFCPTGSSTAKALIIYDSGGAGGNYVGNENCNFTISPTAPITSIILNFTSFDSNDNGDVFTAYNGTNTSGTLLGTYKNTAVTPPNLTATTNMYLTWVTGSANHAAGYNMNYRATYASAGSFSITGVQGGADTLVDAQLTDNSSGVTVVWGASANAVSYDVIIRNGSNTNDVCATANTTATSYNFAGCTSLVLGATYVATVYAKNASGEPVAAANNPFTFTYDTRPTSFTITGATGGTDTAADAYLEASTTVTANWAASTGQTSYDVAIVASDGFTNVCPAVNVASGSTSYTFTGCTLVSGLSYKIEVIAKNAAGSTLAANNYFSFTLVATIWASTSLTGAPGVRREHSAVWTGSEMIIWGGYSSTTSPSLRSGGKYNPATDSWTALNTTNAPMGTYSHAAVWTGTKMIIAGGRYDDNMYPVGGGEYNPSSDSWVPSTFALYRGRRYHTAVWTGTEMIVWGGGDVSGVYLNTGSKYNPSTDSWTATSTGANVPAIREKHTAVWTGTEMIIWGGYNGAYLNTGGKYNPSTDSWTATSTGANIPVGRNQHSAVWTDSEMIVWGGYSGGYLNTGGKYNPSTDSWTTTSTDPNVPTGRYGHVTVWTGSEMIVWGGYNGAYLNTGGKYNPSTDSWASSILSLVTEHTRHTAIWTGSEMIIWGGSNSIYLNTGSKYNPSTDSWTATTTTNSPTSRKYHTAIWTGSEMIIWGGWDGSTYHNTGGKYTPSTNSWIATTTTNSPTSRKYHTAIWTGSEMIVWGGFNGSNLNTGAKYNPSSDSWTATSTGTNVPSVRGYHTAVWTGSEMIIWGGINGSTYYNTGGKYNPSTDSWTATTTTSLAGRKWHTAVWTGTEMIIWGGYTSTQDTNSGGKYNPSTDSWAATIFSNAPKERYNHTAIWTGTEMIVWGGDSNTWGGTLSVGGRYNPSSNTWTDTTAATSNPLPRMDHTAVWTGTEMIVWGGSDGGALNTGGKYKPSTDSWTATSIGTNTPSARTRHTAVWTGTEMVVWGGADPGRLDTGGKYNPSSDSWTTTSTGTNLPSYRENHTAVWTGTHMIVWGGATSNLSDTDTGGKYNPSTNSWTTTSTTGVPGARRYHTAVWTGTEMIVWGGAEGGNTSMGLNTGGKYNPSSNTWTATNTLANVPAGEGKTTVWTGTEMIVWGGFTTYFATTTYYNTGSKYNPSTGLWTATSTGANVPSARINHTAVWTGTEMIIWGGSEFSGVKLNTGSKYNPSTDSWTATSTGTNVPDSRIGHTAVWTGSEMVVWGGNGGSGYLNTGGKYNPSSDSWTASSTGANVPAARDDHSAVWTGTEMMVWGGNGGSCLNTGARYNPSSDSWITIGTGTNVPAARSYYHTAIWTGTKLIVWGGGCYATSTYYNTGGAYAP